MIRKAKTEYKQEYFEDCLLETGESKYVFTCNMSKWFAYRSIGLIKHEERAAKHLYSKCLEDCPKACNKFLSYTSKKCPNNGCTADTRCAECERDVQVDMTVKELVSAVSEPKPELRFEEYNDYRNAGFMWWY